MAVNTGNKRAATKHLRDGIKSQYPEKVSCAICGTTHELEGHHYLTLSLVFKKYCAEKRVTIRTDTDVLEMRDQFYKDNWDAVVTDMVTLCNPHHVELHKLYGKQPPLVSAKKQKHWVRRMFEKSQGQGEGTESHTSNNRFSKHIPSMRVDFASL